MRIDRVEPGPGQESVWDYPRPPALVAVHDHITVVLGGAVVCDTTRALAVKETSHPPTYYLPRQDWAVGSLEAAEGGSFCEWKGEATYWTVVGGGGVVAPAAAWSYERPTPAFDDLAGHVAVYCAQMDRCTVAGEEAEPQPGGFYGGWVTSRVVGPFKGIPGSWGW